MRRRLTYLLYCECMWKEAIVIKGCGNVYDLLACLRRHHLKQYTELIEAQEKCYLNTVIVIYTVIFY